MKPYKLHLSNGSWICDLLHYFNIDSFQSMSDMKFLKNVVRLPINK